MTSNPPEFSRHSFLKTTAHRSALQHCFEIETSLTAATLALP